MKYLKNLAFNAIPFLIACILITGTAPEISRAQETPVFDRLKSNFENGLIFQAGFSHRYEDSFTGETQQNEGVIWIGKDQYKIEGNNQVMVVNDDTSRVYDQDKNRIIISDYVEEEDDFAPSRMLQGVDDSYTIQESGTDQGGTEVVLESDDPFSIFTEVVILLNSDGRPVEIEAVDQAENLLLTRFEDGQFIEASEELFKINAPGDAEIIDLRYTTQ